MENISGFINLNKPSGISSAAAVSKVRRAAGVPCGHMGTLDPMASGVLPVALGNAARLFGYLLEKEKAYRAVFRFGEETDTLDVTGKLLREGLYVPSAEEIAAVLPEFTGEIDQLPPAFSAKNVNGVRAYRLARQGQPVALESRRVKINELTLSGGAGNEYTFFIRCGGGTYIRSLARDIAARLCTSAVMASLVREKSGAFALEDAVGLDDLSDWRAHLVPPDAVFEMPSLDFDGKDAWRLRNGQALACAEKAGSYKLYLDDEFYGIAESDGALLRAKVKICA